MWIRAQEMPQRGHDLWWDGTGEEKEKGLCEKAGITTPPGSELIGELRPECGRKEPQASG